MIDGEPIEVIETSKSKLVLVVYWAYYAKQCEMLFPVLEQLATEFSEQIKVVKVNAHQEEQLIEQLNVSGLPTVIIFSKGTVINTFVGMKQSDEIKIFLNSYLPSNLDELIKKFNNVNQENTSQDVLFCTKCGNRINEGENFCAKCGLAVSKEPLNENINDVETVIKTTSTSIPKPSSPTSKKNLKSFARI